MANMGQFNKIFKMPLNKLCKACKKVNISHHFSNYGQEFDLLRTTKVAHNKLDDEQKLNGVQQRIKQAK